MMKKSLIFITISVLLGVVSVGCANSLKTSSLIQTPALSNETQTEIKNTINKILPSGAEYMTAKKSEVKQSIFVEDINHDGKQEAITLYKDTKGNKQVHLLVLQEESGKWKKVSDVATSFNNLDYFKIEDLEGTGSKEIIVGISMSDNEATKQMLIYQWDGKELSKKVEHSYQGLDIADYDGDKKPDIILLDGEINKLQTAEMFSYEKGQLQSHAIVQLNPDGFHENVIGGKLIGGKRALFVDSGLGAHSMLTEIIAYDNGKLIKIGNQNDGILFKAYPLYSKDINNDGVIEVGGMYIPKGYEDAALAEIPFIYEYVDYSFDGKKQTIQQRYTDSEQHFYITIPAKWYGNVTIKKLDKGIQLVSNTNQKILFDVKWINKGSYSDANIKLGETKDTVFYTENKNQLDITNDNFHLLEDEF